MYPTEHKSCALPSVLGIDTQT